MVHFVGAGCGAPDLITLRGQRLIEEADVIIYAGSLVNPQLLAGKKDGCRVLDSSRMTLEEVIAEVRRAEENSLTTVRLHTGDPCLYGAIREQMDALELLGISYDSCPGVSSFCGAAASLNLEYTLPDVSQSVVITRIEGRTKVPEKESIESFAAHQATMVLFLSAGMLPELSARLMEGGYAGGTPAAIVYKASWPDERKCICTVETLAESARRLGIRKTALIIVGNVLSSGPYRRSDLYNPDFETEYRRKNRTAAVISFTERGWTAAERAREVWEQRGYVCQTFCGKPGQQNSIRGSLKEWTAARFGDSDVILFVGAAGIAVRSIAPYVRSKALDPAVLVMDETCRFVIPILSGHLGGANEMARWLSEAFGAQSVITTATDVSGRFAVDVFAKEHGLTLSDMTKAKRISAAVLEGKCILFRSDIPIEGELPEDLITARDMETASGLRDRDLAPVSISVTYRSNPDPNVLLLIPKVLSIGIGCKRGIPAEDLKAFVEETLEENHLHPAAVEKICSIDRKQDEEGLIVLSREFGVPFVCYSADTLMALDGTFHSSEFVRAHTGADNVCERSAVAGSGGGTLIAARKAAEGMTIAVAVREMSIVFRK